MPRHLITVLAAIQAVSDVAVEICTLSHRYVFLGVKFLFAVPLKNVLRH